MSAVQIILIYILFLAIKLCFVITRFVKKMTTLVILKL